MRRLAPLALGSGLAVRRGMPDDDTRADTRCPKVREATPEERARRRYKGRVAMFALSAGPGRPGHLRVSRHPPPEETDRATNTRGRIALREAMLLFHGLMR